MKQTISRTIKSNAEDAPPEPRRCLKHRINPTSLNFDCSLCSAYLEANGDFNKARKLFVAGGEIISRSPLHKHNSSAPAVELNDLIFEYQEIA